MKHALFPVVLLMTAVFLVAASGANHIWVSRPDGALGCEPEKAQSIDAGRAELRKAGVRVHDSRKTSDGMMRVQVCGTPSGAHNAYRITKKSLKRAESLGYVKLDDSKIH